MGLEEKIGRAIEFIRKEVEASGAKGVVVGLSGGVDSSLTLLLAVKALGPSRVLALIMPSSSTPKEDVEDAKWLCEKYGVSYEILPIDGIVEAFGLKGSKRSVGNLKARIRMCILYFYANEHNLLVLGTGDRSELFIGYFTKFGDGAADLFPISCFLKTEVKEALRILGVPERIWKKEPAPRLFEGHTARKELGMAYEEIDKIIKAYEEGKIEEIKEKLGKEKVRKILEMHRATRHKLKLKFCEDLK